ncbi:outer membrane protein assembly factor [Thalassobellus sediminis]|uniref:outer membrane protein assembly factor n=1 Tax=Thalassobellus sediminis TaxID=3367753 RepID=UPI0037BB2D16
MRKTIFILISQFISLLLFSQESSIASLNIRGFKKTKTSFIENVITSHAGGVLDSVQLDKDIIRLKRLPLISHASYQVFYSHKNSYNVFVNIEENFTLIPVVNVWTATNQQFAYKIGLYDFNFLGKGLEFGGFYQNNGYDSYSINLRAPYLFSSQWGIAINHQNWSSEEPLYFNEGSSNYLYNNKSFEVLGLFEYNFNHKFQFGVNFFTEKYKYLTGLTSDDIPINFEIDKILFKLIYDLDYLDYNYQYVDGFRSLLYTQFVTTNNSFQDKFFIAWNDFFYYKQVGKKGNWANRLRFGLSSNNDSPFAPFSVDNNLNVRGVGNIIDRGTGVIVLNTEYRHTLIQKGWFAMQSNIFVDAGTWRNPGGRLSDFTKSQNVKIYPGIGLRFIHAKIFNAVFRIDYGYGITENASKGIVFGIGQYF